jgi:integral membrane protein
MYTKRTLLLSLIWLGIIEGLSTLFLFFVAMPMKYMYEEPLAVKIAGPVHGFLFLGLVALFIIGKTQIPLSTKTFVWGLVGAVLPFGPFVVDVKLYKLLKLQK